MPLWLMTLFIKTFSVIAMRAFVLEIDEEEIDDDDDNDKGKANRRKS